MDDGRLEIESVSFEYARHEPVLREVELRVGAGQILALLGPSGSGKSTLLHLVAGFLRLPSGSIRIGGQLASGRGVHLPPRQRGIGMVFQGLALWPHLRVEAHLDFVLRCRAISRHERERRKGWALDVTELRRLARRFPAELSGGEAQRLAIARAIAPGPRVLVLDEPLAALDERLRREMLALIARVHTESNATVLLVTHDARDALALASRTAIIVAGKLHQEGPSEEVHRFPASREAAELCGAVTFLAGELEAGGRVRTVLGTWECLCPCAPGRRVIVPLRPEALTVEEAGDGAGRVKDARLAGEAWEVEIELPGAAARCRSPARLPAGARVSVRVREPVWAFEAAASQSVTASGAGAGRDFSRFAGPPW
jgi:iron(III) transport system ATP-binding protein